MAAKYLKAMAPSARRRWYRRSGIIIAARRLRAHLSAAETASAASDIVARPNGMMLARNAGARPYRRRAAREIGIINLLRMCLLRAEAV